MGSQWLPALDKEHTIYRYTDSIYKVIQWHDRKPCFAHGERDKFEHYDKKLDSSISRTKRLILEKALCNPWQYFCTLTISADKFDRDDLQSFWKCFSQWVRDQRKKGKSIAYLLVPERHENGAWHAHGFLNGIPVDDLISFAKMHSLGYVSAEGRPLPYELRKNGYLNWSLYQEKFGYCSLDVIRDPVAAGFYVTKYITKGHDRMVAEIGMKAYYCSQGLNKAQHHIDFYGSDPFLERILVNDYDYCKTGMTHALHGLDWSFMLEYDGAVPPLELLDFNQECPELAEADRFYAGEQTMIKWVDKYGRSVFSE